MNVCIPSNGSPLAFLSHFWIALDQATYDALRSSSEVAALGAVKEQTVVAGRESWSGFYWTGRQTYMEFFGAAALPDDSIVGDCGIALSVETQGGVAALAERLRTVFNDKVQIGKQVKTTETGDLPWYTLTYVNLNELKKTAVWVMELDPGILAALHPETPVTEPLSRQQERSWDYRPNQTLDNVVGLTLAVDKERTADLAAQFEFFGWSVQRTGTSFLASGPDVEIRVLPAGARTGITQVDLRLRRSVPRERIHIGNAVLSLAGNTGQLIFCRSE